MNKIKIKCPQRSHPCSDINKKLISERNSKNIELNTKFGKLTVLKKCELSDSKNRTIWECLCDCGNIHIVPGVFLRSGETKSCGCLKKICATKNIDRKAAIWKYIYNSSVKKRSKLKKIEFNLELNDFINISSQKCFYCGLASSRQQEDRFSTNKTLTSATVIYFNGIDRLDSAKGYVLNNCVSCCKICNSAKASMSIKEFYNYIKQLYNFYIHKITSLNNSNYKINEKVLKEPYRGMIKRGVKKNNSTDITLKDFVLLASKPCYYCNNPYSNKTKDGIKYNGLDRVDSTKGYMLDNVVTCCKYCNTYKNTLTQSDFKNHIIKLYNKINEQNEYNL